MRLNIPRPVDFVKLMDLVDLVGMLIGITRPRAKSCALWAPPLRKGVLGPKSAHLSQVASGKRRIRQALLRLGTPKADSCQ
jgi:hypothetical protein